jgi:hypothetical protein
MNKISFLVTYCSQEDQLKRCLSSIHKFYPDAPIIVSQDIDDMEVEMNVTRVIHHDMQRYTWAEACKGLMGACPTDIGVFMEHDCVLLKPIDDLIEKLGEYDLIGVEEVYGGMRNSPGFANQNFFILDTKRFIQEHGLDGINMRDLEKYTHLQNRESGYGISQSSKNIYWLKMTPSGYGHGSYYGDYIHHMWFGAYRKRLVESDGVDRQWLDDEVYRFLKDYDEGHIDHLPERS